ncbi:hypothetical protein EDB85DRAFT_1121525 [Lactarius pseudohatsudake]|nr:hypothetical protein EDB85DRAFT_1121525 [Lactarius pseudohatsudake]
MKQVDPSGTPYARLTTAMFNLTSKITAQRYTRGVSSLPAARPIPQDRAPDWVTEEQTSTGQAHIYRLSGDYNPLQVVVCGPVPAQKPATGIRLVLGGL